MIMRKIIYVLLCAIFAQTNVVAQTMYVALKSGLSIRNEPSEKAKVWGKIPYGQKVELVSSEEEPVSVSTEGFTGYWQKIKFNNKTGYVVDSYLLPVAPPKKGVNTLEEYFNQLSSIAGKSYVKKPGNPQFYGEGAEELTKTLYKNAMEVHEFSGYEYGSNTYFLPEFSMQQAFLLARLLQVMPGFIGEKDPFPSQNYSDANKKVTVSKEGDQEEYQTVNKITIETTEEGAYEGMQIYSIEGQAVIFLYSGA